MKKTRVRKEYRNALKRVFNKIYGADLFLVHLLVSPKNKREMPKMYRGALIHPDKGVPDNLIVGMTDPEFLGFKTNIYKRTPPPTFRKLAKKLRNEGIAVCEIQEED